MYEGLACFYDGMTEDIQDDRVARFVDRAVRRSPAFKAYQKRGETPILLDVACGTGRVLGLMLEKGYDCIGLDLSEAMLAQARANVPDPNVLWICQDMCRMDLFGTVTGICCLTDGVNHLTRERQLQSFLKRAHNFLDPGGVLVFDVLTERHFTENGGVLNCFADFEAASCFWTGRYNAKTGLCVYDISYFERQADGLYTRTDDQVAERVWSSAQLSAALTAAGFSKVTVKAGADLHLGVSACNRLYYICEKD